MTARTVPLGVDKGKKDLPPGFVQQPAGKILLAHQRRQEAPTTGTFGMDRVCGCCQTNNGRFTGGL